MSLLAALGAAETFAAAHPAVSSAVGNFAGGFLQNILGRSNMNKSVEQQKELYDYQTDYKKLMDKMIAAGITPAAAAQGLSGAAPSMGSPSAVTSPNMSSLGSSSVGNLTIPSQIQSNLAAKESKYAEAEAKREEAENYRQQRLFNPLIWRSQIASTWADYSKKLSESEYYSSLKPYYDELKNNLVLKRPYEIRQLKLANSQLLQDVMLWKYKKQNLIRSNEGLSMQNFKMRWENNLRNSGWNPDDPMWQNIGRIALFDPKRAEEFLNNSSQILQILDNKCKESLGEHYKRNIAIVGGLRYLNDRMGQHNLNSSRKLYLISKGVSSFLPWGSKGDSDDWSTKGTYWWNKD